MTVKTRNKTLVLILTLVFVFTSVFSTGAAFATTDGTQTGNVVDPGKHWCSVSYLREGEETASVRYITDFEDNAGSANVPYNVSDVNVQIEYPDGEKERIPVQYDENGKCTKELTVTFTDGSTQTYSVTVIREPGDVITLPWIDACYMIDGEPARCAIDITGLTDYGESYANIPASYDEAAGITFDIAPEYKGKINELVGTFTAAEEGTQVAFTMTSPDKSITKTFTIYLVKTPLSSDTLFFGNVLAGNGTYEYKMYFDKGDFEANGGTYTVGVPYGTITDADGNNDNFLKMIVTLNDGGAKVDLPYDNESGSYVADFELGDDGTYSKTFTVTAENGDQYPAVIRLEENDGNVIEPESAGVGWVIFKGDKIDEREESAVDLAAAATDDGTTVIVPKSIFGQEDSVVYTMFNMQFAYWPDIQFEITYSDGSTFTESVFDGWVATTLELSDVDSAVIKVTATSENGEVTKVYTIRVIKEDPGEYIMPVYIDSIVVIPTPVTPQDEVTNNAGNIESAPSTNADMNKSTTSKGDETTTAVNQTIADKIVENAVANKSEEIVIDATYHTESSSQSTKAATVEVPAETLRQIAEQTEATVTIKTDVAEIKLDAEALAAVAEQAEGKSVNVVAEKVKADEKEVRVDLKVVCSEGKIISDFNGGNVSVTVEVPEGKKDVVCVYIDGQGLWHTVPGQLNEDGTYTFTTGRFLTYAVVDTAYAEETIAAQKEAVKDVQLKLRSANAKTSRGKMAIKLTVSEITDTGIDFEGYVIYRSTKKTSGYKKIFTSCTGTYYNTSAKKGVKYYYKAKGFVTIDGEKVYTSWSKKAIRTAE